MKLSVRSIAWYTHIFTVSRRAATVTEGMQASDILPQAAPVLKLFTFYFNDTKNIHVIIGDLLSCVFLVRRVFFLCV